MWTIDAQIPVDATGPGHRASESIGNGLLWVDVADTLSTSIKDFITGEECLQFSHIFFFLIEKGFAFFQPALGEIVQHTADAQVVYVKATTPQSFEQREDSLPVTEAPQDRSKCAEIKSICTNRNKVAGNTLHLTNQ